MNMKHFICGRTVLAVVALPLWLFHGHLMAQPHTQHTDSPVDHSQHTQQDMPDDEAAGQLRDPHAYSGGYTLTTGPYTLPGQQRVMLADEMRFHGVWVDRFERVSRDGRDRTLLDGNAWIGNSYDRLVLKNETEFVSSSVEEMRTELLWSHAVQPFWDLQLGIRHDSGEGPNRSWLVAGLLGMAPYWFELDANLYLGESGRTALNLEVEYEMLMTQRLILQPRLEIDVFGKTDKALGRGEGLSEVSAGLRLRYEFSRQLAPYIGVERVNHYGETADLLPAGSDRRDTRWVAGIKFWF